MWLICNYGALSCIYHDSPLKYTAVYFKLNMGKDPFSIFFNLHNHNLPNTYVPLGAACKSHTNIKLSACPYQKAGMLRTAEKFTINDFKIK